MWLLRFTVPRFHGSRFKVSEFYVIFLGLRVHIAGRIQRCLRAGHTNTCCSSWIYPLAMRDLKYMKRTDYWGCLEYSWRNKWKLRHERVGQLSQEIWRNQDNQPWTLNREPNNLSSYLRKKKKGVFFWTTSTGLDSQERCLFFHYTGRCHDIMFMCILMWIDKSVIRGKETAKAKKY